jgi:hypothetical protein
MARARPVGSAFFPLDEQLGLLATGVTPRAEETLVRLASWMSFADAQELLHDLLGVRVSTATARRHPGHWDGSACGLRAAGGASQAGAAPRAGGSGEASDECGWGVCASGGRGMGGSQVAHPGGGDARQAWRGVSGAGVQLFAAHGRPALYASSPDRNAATRTGTGDSGVCGARWRGVAARAGGLPPGRCGAHLGFSACRRVRQCDWAGGASRWGSTAQALAGGDAPSAQAPGASARPQTSGLLGGALSQFGHL